VLDDTADLKQILLRIARFFRRRVGAGSACHAALAPSGQEEVLQRLLTDRHDSDVTLLTDIAQAMRDASICGARPDGSHANHCQQ